MRICRALHLESAALNVEGIRHIINHESTLIFRLYMQELSDFVPINVEVIFAMAKMINSNILTIAYMKEVCAILNKEQESAWSCNNVCHLCMNLQPFSILYNLGLIGVLKRSPADVVPIQSFQNIGNSILGLNIHNLSESDYYFVHPALANYARDSRFALGMNYWSNEEHIIGDGCLFALRSKKTLRPFITRSIDQLRKEKIFISSTIDDLADTRKIVSKTLEARGFHTYLSEMPSFDLADAQLSHSHDHCIDELLKCKSVIF